MDYLYGELRMIRRATLTSLFTLATLTSACVPMYDPATITNLTVLKQKVQTEPTLAEASCRESLSREEVKLQSGLPGADKKTVRHLREACDCLAGAGDSAVKLKACELNLEAYKLYEDAKRRSPR